MGGAIDLVAIGAIGLALLRGLWIGVVREAFSLAALAAAVFAFRALREPVAEEIAMRTQWDPLVAAAAGGGLVVIGALVFVTIVGAIVRRLVNTAGLSFVDRLGGGVVGAAEGALLVGLALFGATQVLGPRDPLLEGSRAVEMVQSLVGVSTAEARRPDSAHGRAATDPPSGRADGSDR